MLQNIKNKNSVKIQTRLLNDEYFDFTLYDGEVKPISGGLNEIVRMDFSEVKNPNDRVYSSKTWENAVNEGCVLKNIGLTGVDNGIITYRKDRISNKDFLDIYTKSSLELKEDDLRFFMTPVSGNTLDYSYEIEKNDDCMSLKGGFYQGFFKLSGKKYQTLPETINDKWDFNITLRKRNDYSTKENILNNYNLDNSGMFLYIGTRAENKFWPYYRTDDEKMKEFYNSSIFEDEYFKDYEINENKVLGHQYLENDAEYTYNDEYSEELNEYFSKESYFDENEGGGYFNTEEYIDNDEECNTYFEEDIDIKEAELKLDSGDDISKRKPFKFTTDNKFIFFNHTPTGFTVDNWVEGDTVEMESSQLETEPLNYFTLFNHTPTGYTTDSVSELKTEHESVYKVLNDVTSNAIGFKVNNDGSITYRYIIKDCKSTPNYFKVESETTKPNIVKDNEWHNVSISLVNLGEMMKIEIKVDDKLKFISKELPLLNLREINDMPEKQETVPYNISIGGGSQGLAEVIYLDYYKKSDYILPIEKYFCGSFIGDIKSFSMKIK